MISLIDDLVNQVAKDKSPKEIEDSIIHMLRSLKLHMKDESYIKMLKSVRHRINKYINFGDW